MRVLIGEEEIAARVAALAAEIARTITGDFVVVGLLKGAALFVADLARALDRAGARPEIEFMRLASYGLGTESSGAVRLIGEAPDGLAGRPVLLVDDIVDTGRSIAFAAELLRGNGAGGFGSARSSTSRRGGRFRSRSISSVSLSQICSSPATAPTTPRNTAISRISGSSNKRRAAVAFAVLLGDICQM